MKTLRDYFQSGACRSLHSKEAIEAAVLCLEEGQGTSDFVQFRATGEVSGAVLVQCSTELLCHALRVLTAVFFEGDALVKELTDGYFSLKAGLSEVPSAAVDEKLWPHPVAKIGDLVYALALSESGWQVLAGGTGYGNELREILYAQDKKGIRIAGYILFVESRFVRFPASCVFKDWEKARSEAEGRNRPSLEGLREGTIQ
jgi:hypothetical protein